MPCSRSASMAQTPPARQSQSGQRCMSCPSAARVCSVCAGMRPSTLRRPG
ncbi:Uncharacterised protein [Bordetella pertussis]|nr:Uncharacterised protein [Bordetella pertussis]